MLTNSIILAINGYDTLRPLGINLGPSQMMYITPVLFFWYSKKCYFGDPFFLCAYTSDIMFLLVRHTSNQSRLQNATMANMSTFMTKFWRIRFS